MTRRLAVAILCVVVLAALAWERGADSDAVAPRPQPRLVPSPAAPPGEPLPLPDPADVRNVFRFADTEPGPAPGGAALEAEGEPAPPRPAGEPRLVGLVRRGGNLMAAIAADGDVVLVGPGETTGDLTVLAVGEDGVRVRHADGREETLPL